MASLAVGGIREHDLDSRRHITRVAGAVPPDVPSVSTDDIVCAWTIKEVIIGRAAVNEVIPDPAVDRVVGCLPVNGVLFQVSSTSAPELRVASQLSLDDVAAVASAYAVAVFLTKEVVVIGTSTHSIIPRSRLNIIDAVACGDYVRTCRPTMLSGPLVPEIVTFW